jgi:hypothetical protein
MGLGRTLRSRSGFFLLTPLDDIAELDGEGSRKSDNALSLTRKRPPMSKKPAKPTPKRPEKDLNFKVPLGFHTGFKLTAAKRDMPMKEVLMDMYAATPGINAGI